jgi:ribonuclease BN (tRNA processing enzyme)
MRFATATGRSTSLSRESGDFFRDVYEMHEYDPQDALILGNANVRFTLTTHYIAAYAMRYESSASLVYSSDTAYNERVAALAAGADLFVCEATLGPHGVEHTGVHGHISAAEAGLLAQKAGVKALMLTHYGAECDTLELKRAAQVAFTGDIAVADDHMQIIVGEKLQAVATR